MTSIYEKRHQINAGGRMVELISFNIDPSWRLEWILPALAVGIIIGWVLGLCVRWPCVSEILRPYLVCPGVK